MRIVHITGNYIEGWGYQENLLPLYQKHVGHDVVVISDNNHLKYSQNSKLAEQIISKGTEYEHDGIKIYKIRTYFNTSATSLFCRGLYKILEREHPDIIFHHDINTSTLSVAAKYKRRHPAVKLYADNHADWINESKNKIWHLLFCKVLIPWQVWRLGDVVDYYIGVSPLRCQYLHKMYGVPEKAIRFLPIGCDTMGAEKVLECREELRQQYQIKNDAFVIASGGKLDKTKGTLVLIEACERLRHKMPDLHLVLFGKMDETVVQAASHQAWITMEGWCDRQKTLSLLKLADVACWPWLHTTLIEDSVAVGTPLIVKMSDNVSHFAREKSGYFMNQGHCEELVEAIQDVKIQIEEYRKNVVKAQNKYSYATLIQNLENETFVL